MSLVYPAVFCYYQNGSLQETIAVHVDDFFWAGLIIFKCNVISKLQSRFNVGKETASAFKYLGLGVSQDENNSVTLSQEEYISGLKQAEVRSEDKKELLQDVCFRYANLGNDSSLKLVVYADGAHGNLPDGGSQRGYLLVKIENVLY